SAQGRHDEDRHRRVVRARLAARPRLHVEPPDHRTVAPRAPGERIGGHRDYEERQRVLARRPGPGPLPDDGWRVHSDGPRVRHRARRPGAVLGEERRLIRPGQGEIQIVGLGRARARGADRRDTDGCGRALRDRGGGQAEVERWRGQRGGGRSGRQRQDGRRRQRLHRRRHPGIIASATRPRATTEMSAPIRSDLVAQVNTTSRAPDGTTTARSVWFARHTRVGWPSTVAAHPGNHVSESTRYAGRSVETWTLTRLADSSRMTAEPPGPAPAPSALAGGDAQSAR